MLITSSHPATAASVSRAVPSTNIPSESRSQVAPETPAPTSDTVTLSSADRPEGIKWGPVAGVLGAVGAASALAGSGLGVASAVPAFVIGGAAGFVLVTDGVMKLIDNGRDSSATGPIAGFAGVVGGLGMAVGASALAMNYGSPMIGLGAGIVGAGLTLAYGLSLANE